jgi:hypothetical protein
MIKKRDAKANTMMLVQKQRMKLPAIRFMTKKKPRNEKVATKQTRTTKQKKLQKGKKNINALCRGRVCWTPVSGPVISGRPQP